MPPLVMMALGPSGRVSIGAWAFFSKYLVILHLDIPGLLF